MVCAPCFVDRASPQVQLDRFWLQAADRTLNMSVTEGNKLSRAALAMSKKEMDDQIALVLTHGMGGAQLVARVVVWGAFSW